MSSFPDVPRIHSEKDLVHIKDLVTAFAVGEDLNIDMTGVFDMSDAIERIKINFSTKTAHNIYVEQDRVLKEAVQADRSNRENLLELFATARKYLDSLPSHFQADLQHVFPDVLPTLDSTTSQLQKNDCIIVVAGEKGAGKTSLVNLLVGCKVLPTDLLKGTRTICELRHSQTRRYVLHRWDRKGPPVVKECRHDNESEQFLKELTKMVTFVDESTSKNPFEKIEIYWPLPILGEGVVIVDSPGIGESRKVSQQLEHYMSRAFGFIYVINISNAGGIHKDRLGQLLRHAVELSDQGFDPSTALFVCNWWDQVDPGRQDHVLQETLNRLGRVWPGVRRQQVFPLSSTQALRAVERGHVEDRYRDIVQAVRHVLPTTFNVKLSQYYRWLSAVLKRSLYTLKISSNVGRKEMAEKETAFHNVRNQIEALESESGTHIHVMQDGFRREVDNITRKLTAFLQSESCVMAVSSWTSHDCPASDKDIKKVGKEAASRFCEKLATLVDAWEMGNNVVSKVKSNILKAFQRDLELFEDQVKKIEGVLFEGIDSRIINDLHSSMKQQMPVKHVWKKARKEKGGQSSEQGCFSLGSAISGCKTLDIKASSLKALFKGGSVGPNEMAEASRHFLQQFKDVDLATATRKFFDRIAKRFDAACRLLPEFLKADRRLMQTLEGEVTEEQERLASMYPKLMKTCITLQGTLDMFYVERLMAFDFSMKDIQYNAAKPIGRGSFADVFRGVLSSEEKVALKIQRSRLTSRNVTDVLLEDRTLRDISHDNIIRYYGAARERQGSDLRWVMVMELCTRTISQRFISEDANVPGCQDIPSLRDAMHDVALFASQICSALCYLHNKGIVHRDLKPDNILLTEEEKVKLTDVGLAKQARDIAGTLAGTPVYMAPEVLLQRGQYDMKADVYSLAIILWELWYGQDAADHIAANLFGSLEDAVKAGLRPSVTMARKPPDDWLKLIRAGWEFEAVNRPSSRDMADFFDNFLRKNQA